MMTHNYNQPMDQEFPFEELVEALNDPDTPLSSSLAAILKAVARKNIEWTYSVVSTLIEILKSKEEQPIVHCQCLSAAALLMHTCQYPLITLFEVYLMPIVTDIALYRYKKTEEQTSYYFQKSRQLDDNPEMRELSRRYITTAVELIHYAAIVKPYRTVENDQLKQSSRFTDRSQALKERGIEQPSKWKWVQEDWVKQDRKKFIDKLRRFGDEADEWIQFLLMNLLDQVRSNKKDLLELRQLLTFGESFLTSAAINFCEEELLQLGQQFQHKKKYLGILNQLVRGGDMEAIITIKNSEFVPSIAARVSQVQGHLGINKGQGIMPQIQASKQAKKDFYVQFLRSVENWSQSMPPDYDADHFNIKDIYKFLKMERQFKFPDNLHLARFHKQITTNLENNKQRNAKIIEILQNMTQNSKPSLSKSRNPASKMSNILHQSGQQSLQKSALQNSTSLSPVQLKKKLDMAQDQLKLLTSSQQQAEKAFQQLVPFKDNWINNLESLDLESADEDQLEQLVVEGQQCVQQIQLIVPLYNALHKGKINFKEFKQRVAEMLEFHHDVSVSQQRAKNSINNPKSLLASKLKSRHSKMAGKNLFSKMKSKSRIDASRMDMSKVIDRSQILSKSKSKIVEKSRHDLRSTMKKKVEIKQPQQEIPEEKYQPGESVNSFKHADKDFRESHRSKASKYSKSSNKQSPVRSRMHDKSQNISKHSIKPVEKSSQVNKLVRIADYEPQPQMEPQRPKRHTTNHLDNSQLSGRGSRVLLRRSVNKGSRLSVSGDSRVSERRSTSGCKLKEGSLARERLNRTKKVSEIEEELGVQKVKIDETIEFNGNILKDGKKSRATGQEECPFRDGVGSISSIHSNSHLQHQAQKVLLNITAREELNSQYPQPHTQSHREEKIPKAQEESGGDYYMQSAKVTPMESPKKQKPRSVYSSEDPQFKNLFTKKGNEVTQRKTERRHLDPAETVQKVGAKLSDARSLEMRHQPRERQQQAQRNSRPTNKRQNPYEKMHLSHSRSIDMKNLEQEKNKEIVALQKKILDLEKESMKMKTKLTAMDNELKSIKSSSQNGSERGYPQFTVPSQSNYEKSSARGSSVGRKKGEMTRFQREVESGYKQYLQKIKGSTFRKSLLKMKCLVHKSEQLEVGCLSQRGQHILQSTLYITPHRYDLCDFALQLVHDNNLKIKAVPEVVKRIPCKKQQKIHLTIEVVRIPFCLPEVEINYKAQSEYSSNYNRLTLPLGFNKFTEIRPLDSEEQSERHSSFVRSDNFKLNLKVVKLQKIGQAFPSFALIPPTKDRPQTLLAANCNFMHSRFNLMLNLQEKSSWIEGFLKEGDVKAMNFLLCTLKEMLDGSKK